MKTATPTPRHPTAKAQPRSRTDLKARVAQDRLRSREAESDLMLDPSTTIRASASVLCNWSRTNDEVTAQLRAVTPATTVRIRTARVRLASLALLSGGFAMGLGLGDLLDLAVCPVLYPA